MSKIESYKILDNVKQCCTCRYYSHETGSYEGCEGFECNYNNCFESIEPNGLCDKYESDIGYICDDCQTKMD